ncbi:unnamed protein product [Penicillium nalgiovense]|nr:unnamed protein product [Penicillium nalgiovense]
MEVPRSWFPIILDEGDKVTLNKPTRSEWVINKMANTDSYQCELQSANSYACVLFTYHDVADGQEAFMRVYFQVPHTSSENTPQLLAYRRGSQDRSGIVPFPNAARPRNLVWDEEAGALCFTHHAYDHRTLTDVSLGYFVGFRDAMPFKAKGTFGEEWFPRFDLAKPPQSHCRSNRDSNGDISGWQL